MRRATSLRAVWTLQLLLLCCQVTQPRRCLFSSQAVCAEPAPCYSHPILLPLSPLPLYTLPHLRPCLARQTACATPTTDVCSSEACRSPSILLRLVPPPAAPFPCFTPQAACITPTTGQRSLACRSHLLLLPLSPLRTAGSVRYAYHRFGPLKPAALIPYCHIKPCNGHPATLSLPKTFTAYPAPPAVPVPFILHCRQRALRLPQLWPAAA
jgi:hypothetical protein